MSEISDRPVRRGTTNVFADLGYPDADTHLLEAELVNRIQDLIDARKLTQLQAAKLLRLSQPDVSRMLRGYFRDFSVERLMRFLTALDCEVDIVIRPQGKPAEAETIHLRAAVVQN